MYKIFFFFIGLLCFNESFAQLFLRAYDQKLDSLYRVLIKDLGSAIKQREFLELFPKDFEALKKTYEFNEKWRQDPMHGLASAHILEGLAILDKVGDTLYYTRLINLSIGGKWEADAVNYLQLVLRKKVEEKPGLVFALLSKYPKTKVYSFWYFYFHSLHPLKEGIPRYLLKVKEKYPGIYQELLKAFKNADGQAIC